MSDELIRNLLERLTNGFESVHDRLLYVDMLMGLFGIATSSKPKPLTSTEINDDMQDPIIAKLARAGKLPMIPPELLPQE